MPWEDEMEVEEPESAGETEADNDQMGNPFLGDEVL